MALGSNGAGEARAGSRKPTIVIVDDCQITLTATAETLGRAGYRVISRDRPAGCVAMMLQEKPDLVLLDVCMPTVSGDTLVKLFSKASPNSGTIILLYSALDEPLLRSKAKASGAHGYIPKTNDAAGLVRAIRRWLRPSLIDTRIPLPSEGEPAPATVRGAPARVASAHGSSAYVVSPGASAHNAGAQQLLEPPPSSRLRDLDMLATVSGDMKRASGSQPGPPTVLFVDDDMMVLSGYRRQLHGQPFEFDFALSGAQALRLLTSETPPSVVVSDLLMPDPNGREVLRQALDRDTTWGQRFIIVTGQSVHDARLQLDPRFSGTVLRKPVETEVLSAAIRGSLAALSGSMQAENAR